MIDRTSVVQTLENLNKIDSYHNHYLFQQVTSNFISCYIQKTRNDQANSKESLIHKNTLAQILYEVFIHNTNESKETITPVIILLKPQVICGFDRIGLYEFDFDNDMFVFMEELSTETVEQIQLHQLQHNIHSSLGIGYVLKNHIQAIDSVFYILKMINFYLEIHGDILERTLTADIRDEQNESTLLVPPICLIQWLYPVTNV